MVAEKLAVEVSGWIYKQIWLGRNVERWADIARESGRNRPAYFAWLCSREGAAGTSVKSLVRLRRRA